VRGTYKPRETYRALDIVSLHGGSFIARCDDPGECPGEGWQSLTMPGKRGDRGIAGPQGDRGPAGPKGERGEPAPTIIGWHIDREAYALRALLSDRSETPVLDLRGLFEQFISETR